MRFYRIADARHGPESGEGARLHGGRWNSPGRAVIYACETQAGAMLEKLVHANGRMPKHQVCVTFEAPDSIRTASLEPKDVPGWSNPDMIASRKAGDAWLEQSKSAVLRVPSIVFDAERNVMINPGHPDFRRFKVVARQPVRWDECLFTETLRS
ncbi:MAG: RES domain-containing protein [Gammaproteobacteria bacterium]|nr:RES domain-containing protein [Gammaproteobacteria bacterium]